MKTVGIICVKENSNRFPGKNLHIVDGAPMFIHNARLLQNCPYIDKVYICLDTYDIAQYCVDPPHVYNVIQRNANMRDDEQPYFDVLKFAYQSINEKCDIIASILPNCIGHTQESVNQSIEKIINDSHVHEVRSFDADGNQSGILAFRETIVKNDCKISNHMASVNSNGREIHYLKELAN